MAPTEGKREEKQWTIKPGEGKSETLLTDVKAWRKAHPKATFVEIEDEVHRRMMQREAHLLRDAAQESSSGEWGKETDGDPPSCPNCQVP